MLDFVSADMPNPVTAKNPELIAMLAIACVNAQQQQNYALITPRDLIATKAPICASAQHPFRRVLVVHFVLMVTAYVSTEFVPLKTGSYLG